MEIMAISSFQTFIEALRTAGFTMSGDNGEGIFTLADHYEPSIQAHTDMPDTDPWVWRMQCLKDFDDVFYSKVFFNKGGFITGEWYPYFYVVRRQHQSFEELYDAGKLSYESKQVYKLISQHPHIALHEISAQILSDEGSKAAIEKAITQLQMYFFVTITGEKYKVSKEGSPFGWPVTTFATVEAYVDPKLIDLSSRITFEEAVDKITQRILELNPTASEKKIKRFLNI